MIYDIHAPGAPEKKRRYEKSGKFGLHEAVLSWYHDEIKSKKFCGYTAMLAEQPSGKTYKARIEFNVIVRNEE